MNKYLFLAGRILLGLIFFLSGVGKIFNFAGTQDYMAAMGMPMTGLFLVAAIIIEIGGALMLFTGFKMEIGAWALMLFLIPATLIFHSNLADQTQMIMFLKNVAIMGGLLNIVSFGAGPVQLKSKSA